jgi:probable rRNA maturation factor
MNRVDINCEGFEPPEGEKAAEQFILEALACLNIENWDVSVLLCDNDTIRKLNRDFRGKDEATDVLSFINGGTYDENGAARYTAGDIVVSLETLKENAVYFNVDEAEELRRLFIHGILHLSGLDHATNDPAEPMLQQQESLLSRCWSKPVR